MKEDECCQMGKDEGNKDLKDKKQPQGLVVEESCHGLEHLCSILWDTSFRLCRNVFVNKQKKL